MQPVQNLILPRHESSINTSSELVLIVERVDDVALLIGQMIMMGLPEV